MAARLRTMSSCPNEATECYCGSGEFEIARDYVAGFANVAEASACRRLMELMDQAWAKREMRLCVIEAERGMVWE